MMKLAMTTNGYTITSLNCNLLDPLLIYNMSLIQILQEQVLLGQLEQMAKSYTTVN